MNSIISKTYGGKTRIRVCGLGFIDEKLVLVKHEGLGRNGIFWSPPGGGVRFGESLETALEREFKEETKLTIRVGNFLFVHEFIENNLHAIELFFMVEIPDGVLSLGADPEHSPENQILKEVGIFSEENLSALNPNELHQVFELAHNFHELKLLRGYFKSENNSIK